MNFKKYTRNTLICIVFFYSKLFAQTSQHLPDTIYVSDVVEIQIKLPSQIHKATFRSVNPQYEQIAGSDDITLTAKIPNTKPDIITVIEGKKEPYNSHSFIIAYKENPEKSLYDFSNREKLNQHDKEFANRNVGPTINTAVFSSQIKTEEKKRYSDGRSK